MSDEPLLAAEIAFARYLIQAGRLDAARDALAPLQGAGSQALLVAWNELGSAMFQAARYREAEAAFRQALALEPSDGEARMGLGYALFNMNQLVAAEACFVALTDAGSYPPAWRALAAVRMNMSQSDKAGDALRRALASDPQDAESHALLGLLAYRISQADLRWRDWTRQNLKDPKARPDLLAGKIDKRDLEAALDSIAQARRLDPRIRTDELGARLLVASGRPEVALDFLADCPEPDGRTWQWMADISWLLRCEDQARTYLRKSLMARMEGEVEARPLDEEALGVPRVAQGLACHKTQPPAATPQVWLHWDAPAYFSQSIASVLAASPATPLVILGDATNAIQPCQHMPLLRRASRAFDFLECYRHASENDFVYEAFCLMRWFFLQDWAEIAGVERLATMDSDVLLFADLERELVPRLKGRDFAFTGPMGPHLALITQKGLGELCDFYTKVYATGAPDIGGQVSDMTLLPHFLKTRDWADLSAIENGARVDMNIRQSEGFVLAGESKEIRFKDGQAFARLAESNDSIRLLALHFQGRGKPLMPQALRCEDLIS